MSILVSCADSCYLIFKQLLQIILHVCCDVGAEFDALGHACRYMPDFAMINVFAGHRMLSRRVKGEMRIERSALVTLSWSMIMMYHEFETTAI